jgi:hypothetical protein
MTANANVSFGIKAVNQTTGAFRKARSEIIRTKRTVNGMSGMMMQNRRIIQQAGMQMSDFAVQVGGGQSAILAFTQNVPQFVQGFGAVGGVLAALITIAGTLTLVMHRTGTSIAQITPLAGVLADEFKGLAAAANTVKEFMIDMANLVVNNLDRLFITASLIAGFFAGRWVVSMIAARVATLGLAGSITALTVTMLALARRVFYVALFVAIGEVIYRIIELARHLGGFGAVLTMIGNIGVETWNRIKEGANLLKLKLEIIGAEIAMWWSGLMQELQVTWASFLGGLADKAYATGLDIIAPGVFKSLTDMADHARTVGDIMLEEWKIASMGVDELKDKLAEASAAFGRPIKSIQELIEALKAANKAGTDIDVRDWFGGGKDDKEGGGDKITERLKSIAQMAEDLASSISSSMGEAFMSMVDGTKSVSDAFRSMARDIIKKLYEVLVVERMVANIATLFGGKKNEGGGLFGNTILPALFGKRAGGGPVSAGRPYLVGERGPELFIPGRSGAVAASGSGGGSVVVNQYNTFTSDVKASVRDELNTAAPQLVELSKAAMMDARRRGGAMAAAFG